MARTTTKQLGKPSPAHAEDRSGGTWLRVGGKQEMWAKKPWEPSWGTMAGTGERSSRNVCAPVRLRHSLLHKALRTAWYSNWSSEWGPWSCARLRIKERLNCPPYRIQSKQERNNNIQKILMEYFRYYPINSMHWSTIKL